MNVGLVNSQAEQDQLWMAWDAWYIETTKREEFVEFVELLDNEEPEGLLERIQSLDIHGVEVMRCLALQCLRELVLRSVQAELRIEEEQEHAE